MTRKQRRIALIGSALGVLALAVGAGAQRDAQDSIVFFNSPTDVVEKHDQARRPHPPRRPGERRAVLRARENMAVRFDVTDGSNTIAVAYQGLLPDLFREGQGVVTEGALEDSGTLQGRQRAGQARRNLHAAARSPTP